MREYSGGRQPVIVNGEVTGTGRIIDLSSPDNWPNSMPDAWRNRLAALRELDQRSRSLAAQAEQLLAQPDATSALRGIGYAVLALRVEFEAEQARRPD